MILARVVGTVNATRKDERLAQHKLLLVAPYFYYEPTHDTQLLVVVDTVDAGVGDDVLVCLGTPARWACGSEVLPLEAATMAVVDRCQLQLEQVAGPSRRLVPLGGRWPAALERL